MTGEIISIFHDCVVLTENSVTRVTVRHDKAGLVKLNSDFEIMYFFYPHLTRMINIYSCILLMYNV